MNVKLTLQFILSFFIDSNRKNCRMSRRDEVCPAWVFERNCTFWCAVSLRQHFQENVSFGMLIKPPVQLMTTYKKQKKKKECQSPDLFCGSVVASVRNYWLHFKVFIQNPHGAPSSHLRFSAFEFLIIVWSEWLKERSDGCIDPNFTQAEGCWTDDMHCTEDVSPSSSFHFCEPLSGLLGR